MSFKSFTSKSRKAAMQWILEDIISNTIITIDKLEHRVIIISLYTQGKKKWENFNTLLYGIYPSVYLKS